MSVSRVSVICMVLALCASAASATEPSSPRERSYAWPLPEHRSVTGAFGEYRDGHFHTGFDLSTGGKNGLSVHAAADGYVYRVSDGWTGFGRAIYIMHDGGVISVYAHLERFSDRIADYVKQQRAGRPYREKVELYPKPGQFGVSKGDVIAYSGESGAGLPHLHFEVRRGETQPISPADVMSEIADDVPPEPIEIIFRPASTQSTADKQLEPVSLPFRKIKSRESRYETAREAVLEGPIAVDVMARDLARAKSGYRLIPRLIRFWMDDEPYRSIAFDRISYENQSNKQQDLIYDPLATKLSQGVYAFRLYSELPRPVRFVSDPSPLLNCDAIQSGKHTLRIELLDDGGNVTTLTVPFKATKSMPRMFRSAIPSRLHSALPAHILFTPSGAQLLVCVTADQKLESGQMNAGAGWSDMTPAPDGTLAAFVPFDKLNPGMVTIEVRASADTIFTASEPLEFQKSGPNAPAVQVEAGSGSALHLPERALYADAAVYALRADVPSTPDESTLPAAFVYGFYPGGWPLKTRAELRFHAAPVNSPPLDRLGVYRFDPRRDRWSFVDAVADSQARTVSAEISSLGVYGLFDDQIPPEVGTPDRPSYGAADIIKISAVDRGSGVSQGRSEIRAGDAVYEDWVYDEDRKQIQISAERLSRGRRKLTAHIRDKLGNVRAAAWTVEVR